MGRTTIADPATDMNPGAHEALRILSGRPIDLGDMEHLSTHALYNGRERGFVVSYKPDWRVPGALHLFVAADRHTDEPFVVTWESRWMQGQPPPTAKDVPDEAWRKKSVFATSGPAGAAEHVENLITGYRTRPR